MSGYCYRHSYRFGKGKHSILLIISQFRVSRQARNSVGQDKMKRECSRDVDAARVVHGPLVSALGMFRTGYCEFDHRS